jgi:hypothetical protein
MLLPIVRCCSMSLADTQEVLGRVAGGEELIEIP